MASMCDPSAHPGEIGKTPHKSIARRRDRRKPCATYISSLSPAICRDIYPDSRGCVHGARACKCRRRIPKSPVLPTFPRCPPPYVGDLSTPTTTSPAQSDLKIGLVVVGLLGIAAGIVTFAWPGITAILLVLFIGAWALVHGIFEIIGAIQLRKEIDNEWMLILGDLLSVVFGLIVLFAPGAGALGLIWAIASYSIVFGILFIALALRLRKYGHAAGPAAAGRSR